MMEVFYKKIADLQAQHLSRYLDERKKKPEKPPRWNVKEQGSLQYLLCVNAEFKTSLIDPVVNVKT